MAKGKNKAIAERRVTALAEIGTIDALRLKIKNLEEELVEVKSRAEEVNALKNQNIAELNQKLRDNTSAEVEELRGIVVQLRNDLGESRKSEEKLKKKWHRMLDKITGHFETVHGMDRLDVFGTIVKIEEVDEETGEDLNFETAGEPILIAESDLVNKIESGKFTREQVKLLQRKKRGL
jgi:seryl-tRNA synthetase